MLKEIHDFLMAEQCSCMNVCLQLRNTAMGMHEIFKSAADDNAMEITQNFERFFLIQTFGNFG